MRRIELLEVRLENFRSFRKPAVFELSPTSGFKFIGGRNEVQPRLGPNGVGKSSLWDALLFCLYNSSVKGTRASELVSWGGSGRAHVTTRWLIDGDQTTIERWSSPNLLCIDGLAVEEKNVELLLGLTKKRFLQAIVFGQGVPLFIDLSIPERAALLDETLDLGIWLRLSAAAKQEHVKADVEVRKAREVLARLNGRLESLNDSARLEQLSQSWESAQQNKIDRAIEQVEAFEQDLLELKEKKSSIAERILAIPVLDKSQKSIDALVRYKEELRQGYQALYSQTIVAHEKHKFFENNSSCPTCFQMITPVFRDKQKRELMAAVTTLTREMQDNGADRTERSETVTIAGIPEAVTERIKAAAKAKWFGAGPKPIEIAAKAESRPAQVPGKYWDYDQA